MTLSFREINLRVFQGKPYPHIFFQPRLEPWYDWHRIFNKLPEAYREMGLRGFFDRLGASMRYVHYYTGMPDPVITHYAPRVKVIESYSGGEGKRVYVTPGGELVERLKLTQDETWRTVGFPVKTLDDLKNLRWLCQHTRYFFSEANFEQGSQYMGERGEPQFWVPKSPYQALAQIWMKLQDLIYALADYPAEVEATMQAIDDSYDGLYEAITLSGKVKMLNFGENIHDSLLSPRYFERYLIPFYEKRCIQLRKAGIFAHVHLDGYFHSLLKYLRYLPFEGIEALTPTPQGDVTLEEMAEHIGDKVLLDGIPAVYFLPTFSEETLMESVEKIVRLFYPRLVLGISDELPEGSGLEAIDRVQRVADYCKRWTP